MSLNTDTSTCFLPNIVQSFEQGDLYCNLPSQEHKSLVETALTKASLRGPDFYTGACFQNVMASFASSISSTSPRVCKETQIHLFPFTVVEKGDLVTYGGWGEVKFCMDKTCILDMEDLKSYLTDIFIAANGVVGSGIYQGFNATRTVVPTAYCSKGFGDFINRTQCVTDESEHFTNCSNKTMLDISFGIDKSFEFAVCDDNECIDQMSLEVVGMLANYLIQNKTGTEGLATVKLSEKDFDLTNYCSVAAIDERNNAIETLLGRESSSTFLVTSSLLSLSLTLLLHFN